MRKTFKKIGIGLLTTALTISNLPTGKIPARAEVELLTKEQSRTEQEEASGDNLDESGEKGSVDSGESKSSSEMKISEKSEDNEIGKEQKEELAAADKLEDDRIEEAGTSEMDADEEETGKSETDESKAGQIEKEETKTDEEETGKSETDESEAGQIEKEETKTDESEADGNETDRTEMDENAADGAEVDETDEDEMNKAEMDVPKAEHGKASEGSSSTQKIDEEEKDAEESEFVFTEKSLKKLANGAISFSLKNRDIEENTYAIQISAKGKSYGYQIFIDGKEAGKVLCEAENEGLMEYLSEDSFNLTGRETITIKPLDKKQGDEEKRTGEILKVELIFSDEISFDEDGISLMALDVNEEGVIIYEAEDYFTRKDGNLQDNDNPDVIFSDMQPNEEIEITLGEDFKQGNYRLTIRSNGNRTEYEVEVNGETVGKVTRETSGWDAVDLTDDSLAELLALNSGDTIKITALAEYGKVDFIALTAEEGEPEPEPNPSVNWDYVYEAEDYFTRKDGNLQDNDNPDVIFSDMQPNEEIEITLGEDFKQGNYHLTIRSNGNRTEYEVEVNGETVGKVTRETSGWDAVDLTDDSLAELLTLNPGDTIKITALAEYGKVDFIALTAEEGAPFEEKDTETGIMVSAGIGVVPEGYGLVVKTPSESNLANIESICQEKGIAYAAGMFFYIDLQKLNRSADVLGTGKVTVKIPLPEGYQENAVRFLRIAEDNSIENIKGSIEDGQVVLTITADKLGSTFGILDIRGTMDGHYIYEAENYYTGAGENMPAQDDPDVWFSDIKPGEAITIPVSDQDLPEGNYRLTIRSNGTRTGYAFFINGVPAGTVKRAESGWEAADLTDDTYRGVLHIKPRDEIQIRATRNKNEGDEELFGKIDYLMLSETSETPQTPEVLEKIVLRSSDWYFGKIDNADEGSVNLRPDDQIDYFIRSEDGFSEEENKYRLTMQAGGMRTEYRILVNGKEIGSVSRPDTEWGVLNESQLGRSVTLKAGDILTIYAPEGNWGTVADVTLNKVDKNAPQTLQAEDFYKNSDGIQTDGGVRMCDVQPGESVDFIIPEDMEEGYYRLAALSNGTRMAYLVSVNEKPLGLIRRNPTGWDAADLTEDFYSGVLKLKAGDILTLTATMNLDEGDNLTFGKLDAVILTGAPKPEEPQEKDKITLYASDWYGGSQDSSGGMNVRPGDGIDFILREEDGFTEGDYLIALRGSGFRKNYTVKVNGQPVMDIPLRNSEWGEYLTGTALAAMHLKPGDVVTFYEAESWGCIDYVTFYKGDVPSGNLMSERTGGRLKPTVYEGSYGEKASGTEPVFIYQGEGYYQKQADNPAADLQPGEQIEIPLADNDHFVDGLYQVTVVSCGVRDHMFVKVNGQKTGRIDRIPGDYGMDKMTSDKLESTITLHKGDLLCIEAAPEGWGWVDYIRLDLVQKSETVSQGTRHTYRAMDYYSKKQADSDTADLQPGEKIVIPIADERFEEGYYLVSVTSCGGREKMSVEVNGQESGWINRKANNYGVRALTRDTMPVPVYLKNGDQISICAPSNGGWAWVGQVDLIKAVE